MMVRQKKPPFQRELRDALLFALGFVGAVYEIFYDHGQERPSIIVLIAACLGLPFLLRANGK